MHPTGKCAERGRDGESHPSREIRWSNESQLFHVTGLDGNR